MVWRQVIWTERKIAYLAQHDVTPEDFEYVLANPESETVSRQSGDPAVFGYDPSGRYLFCVYREIDDVTVWPVTAYEVEEP